MGLCVPLYELHVALNARMADLGGWDMPLYYGSQVEEHRQVRCDCGVFGVSRMAVVDVSGEQTTVYPQHLLTSDVAHLGKTGKALYSAMLNEKGGIVDDLIVYLTENGYQVVVNVSTHNRDIAWMQAQAADFKVDLQERGDLAMLAIQGPNARVHSSKLASPACAILIHELKPFQGRAEGDWSIAHTGYTDEDSLKIVLPVAEAPGFLNELVGTGISPASPGARDTLRPEARLNLCGQGMDEGASPLVANTDWTVAWEPVARDFVGRRTLEAQEATGNQPKLAGLVLEKCGMLRAHQVVRIVDIGKGETTSGSLPPTLNKSTTLARVPAATGSRAKVKICSKWYPVRVVQPSFVRHGRPLV